MKHRVEKGAKIRAVGTRGMEHSLTKWRVYTVIDCINVARPSVLIETDNGKVGYFNLHRFEEVVG